MVNRLVFICKQEGIQVLKSDLNAFVESTNEDIRQVGSACAEPIVFE